VPHLSQVIIAAKHLAPGPRTSAGVKNISYRETVDHAKGFESPVLVH